MKAIYIEGERFYADLLGYLPDSRIACLGFIGRRSGVERALVKIHQGRDIAVEHQNRQLLGEKCYRVVKQAVGENRLVRAFVLPNTAVTQVQKATDKDQEDEEKTEDQAQILIWRDGRTEDEADTALWNWLKDTTAVPLLDHWRKPVTDRLMACGGDGQGALASITFDPPGDGRWRGVAANVTDEQVARVVREALISGEAKVPGREHATIQ